MQVVSIVSKSHRYFVYGVRNRSLGKLYTLQMLIDSIDQVVDVGYQFGLVCSIHRCLTDDGISYFVSSVFMLNFVSPSTFMRRFTCSIRDDIERGSVPTGLTVDFPRSYFFIYDDLSCTTYASALSDGVNDPI
jgi:hypothetical protein